MPVQTTISELAEHTARVARHSGGEGPRVRQAAMLLVEDNALIRMLIAGTIEELGHRVVAQAGTIDHARTLAEAAEFDLALLDIKLGQESVTPVAEIIERRGLPFLFVSAYDTSELPPPFDKRPLLTKPFTISKLGAFIDEMLGP